MTLWRRILWILTGQVADNDETCAVEHAPSDVAQARQVVGGAWKVRAPGQTEEAETGGPWYAPSEASLLEPEPMTCPEMSHETRAIMTGLECSLENHDVELPPIPRVPEAVLRCLSSHYCDFHRVADLISEDPSTTTRVLRMANAAIWGVKTTSSIPEAVVRLGNRPLQSLMMSESLMVASRPSRKANRLIAQRFWNRSLAAGCVMRALAPLCNFDPEEAFVIGLLHDVGDVVVLRAIDRFEALSHEGIESEAFEYLCHRFHQPLGTMVADEWALGPTLKVILGAHHAWPKAKEAHRKERLMLMLSDMINQMIGFAHPAVYNLPKARPVAELRLDQREDFLPLLVPLPGQIRERVAAIN